jgi:hypothetical protein
MTGRHGILALIALVISLFVVGVLAQNSRALVPGVSVDSELSEDSLAQVFTYETTGDEIVKLTLISGDGLALGVVVTDSVGNLLAQAQDTRANGFLVVDDVSLDAADTYYVTVFPLAVSDVPTSGEFSISLALANETTAAGTDDGDEIPETEEPTPINDEGLPSADLIPTLEPTTTAVASSTPTGDVEVGSTEEAAPPAEDATEEPAAEATEASGTVVDAISPSQVLTTAGIEVSLTWNASADMNLEVRDPVGGTVFWDSPLAPSGGTFPGFNVNGACETFTADSPTETINWGPGAVPSGSYEILVFYVQDCEANGAVPFTVDVTVDGVPQETIRGTTLPNQVFIASFDVGEDGTVTTGASGVNQGFLPANAADIAAVSQPITQSVPVDGVITSEQPFEAYTFEAGAGDIVSATMESTSGSLDTYLFLIDSAGTTIAQNDDANFETRNSALDAVLLTQPGTYTLVATRYGQRIGGTEGNFTLSLTGATTAGGNVTEALLGVDLPDGLIEVSLIWETSADLQLLVRDPLGDAVFDDAPLISSGGTLAEDGNVGCVRAEGTPYSYIYWPAGLQLRPGTYEIDVWYQNDCQDTTPVSATLNVAIAGQVIISDTFPILLRDHYITTFSIGLDGTVVRGPGGIAGGSETVDFLSALPDAPELTSNVPIQGTISDDNRFDVYTFEGTANEVVSLRMDATAGTLDTLLFLVGPTGIELASNDDAVINETTNSAITEFTLPQTGQYIVIATHYGTIYGGTNGVYTLGFSRLNSP